MENEFGELNDEEVCEVKDHILGLNVQCSLMTND